MCEGELDIGAFLEIQIKVWKNTWIDFHPLIWHIYPTIRRTRVGINGKWKTRHVSFLCFTYRT